MLLSAGLLFAGVVQAVAGDESPLPVAQAPETTVPSAPTSAPDSTVPDPSTTTSEPATTVAPPSSTDAPSSTEVPLETKSPETTVPTDPSTTLPASPVTTTEPVSTTVEPAPGAPDLPVAPPAPYGGWPVRLIRFPVAGVVSFSDDWGDCRDNCERHHIGNDIIGSRLQPLLAATDGVITHFVENHPTAGWGIVVTDSDGWEYRYYHVNNDTPGTDDGLDDGEWRFPTGITLGSTVKAGQVIAFMGDSGNSEHSVPHLHFEIHTPDGTPVDPYASLRTAELLDRCANTGDPMANALFPVRTPSSATQTVLTKTGKGYFLVGRDGAFVPSGDGLSVGDPSHASSGFSCGAGAIVAVGSICSDTSAILATIRQMESGGNYLARAAKASASGAYQYVDSTWNRFGGYTSAWQAPPEVQDARALGDVQRLLDRYHDVSMIPVAWYWPRALSHPEDMDAVPRPDAGNKLTVRQYQQRWLAQYAAQRASSTGLCAP